MTGPSPGPSSRPDASDTPGDRGTPGDPGLPDVADRLDQPLAAAARRHPDRPALAADGLVLSYAELDGRVDEVAARLAAHGVRPGDRVGVHAPKGVTAVTALYAALRAGAVVAPLDPAEPRSRTARMVHGAGLRTLLTTADAEPAARRLAGDPAEGVRGLPHGLSLVPLPATAPDPGDPTEGAGGYVLFTSGSTGWPKGVLLSHRNVLHFARWAAAEFRLDATDRVGSQSPLTFDLSTFDLFSSALAGACVHLLPEVLRLFPRDVVGWLGREEISVFYAVPTFYRLLLLGGGIAKAPPPALRLAAFAGEPFPPHLLEDYVRCFPRVRFYNLYGPTETNVCTYEPLPPGWTAADGLSAGRALPGDHIEVTDADGGWTDGEGEVRVAGETVFLGYLADGGRLTDPTRPVRFRDGTVRRAYATGDLGRLAADGRLELHGRRDHQVKRRGVRIELREIESVLLEVEGVTAAAVVAKTCPGHVGELWAYVVASGLHRGSVNRAMAHALPRRMFPDRVLICDGLPSTARGKTDRTRLAGLPGPPPTAPPTGGASS
ncbi:amino acid adenylation domain-containing protein [Streptomyces sp. LX-29]|uniref:amino acid adenylation domain-containing protein n=1 Tax=Streptomyces sp. LX-29 TaxID=2900152 RepID=UPI00240DB68E|nr:amino acid adenylation domain-containing protein [Streptomyces sp. LX-29]WFB09331.1 amino acid adenylation domain-containing protein [Streptomyces sp. LX-29]